jgi:hypothetical protein
MTAITAIARIFHEERNMLKNLYILVTSLAISVVAAAYGHAATVNVVHGIDGRDLGAEKSLPVDIAVNGSCALKGVTFTQSAKVDLASGDYTITVHPADGNCGVAPVITQSVAISEEEGRSFSAVASLSQNGTPQLAVFNNSRNLGFTPTVSIRHLAVASPVFVTYRSSQLGKPQTSRIRNGKFANLSILTDRFSYSATIAVGSKRKTLARLSGVARRQFIIFNIVGSAKNGLTVIPEKLNP